MDITTLMDIGSVAVILSGIVVIILAGIIEDRSDLPPSRCLQSAFVIVFLITFFSVNAIFGISEMRFVVAAFTMSFLIPYTTTFLMTWIYVSRPSITRVQYTTYLSWLATLVFTLTLRAVLGWGAGDNLFFNLAFAAFLSLADGILGGIFAIFITSQLERFRPTSRQLQ